MKVMDTIARTSLALTIIVVLTVTTFAQDKLLLSEIVVTPTAGEMIEIYNPGTSTVTLTNYYISDATFAGGPTYYYQVVNRATQEFAGGGGSFGDFSAQFPVGATIAAGEYQTIALAGSDDFFAEYGVSPTYELYEDGGSADDIPDMLEADDGTINGQGGLSGGEVVVLFYWDGATDLVTDIDYVVWQDKAEAVDKSGVSIDGPDVDTTPSTYANDVAIADQATAPEHVFGKSMQRIEFTEGSQATSGSNGIAGANETGENLNDTWYSGGGPTPNVGPELPVLKLLITEWVNSPTAGEFIEIYNPRGIAVDLSNYYLTDATFAGGPTYYYQIVLEGAGIMGGGGSFGDFNARFPAGAMIGAGEFQTISLPGSDDFFAEYGVNPTYELFEDGGTADGIPDMLEAETGSINGQGGLSGGEVAILYNWDGASDLVTDIDYVVWEDKAEAVDKTGISIDGPDADATATAYATETAIADQETTPVHSFGASTQRIDFNEGTQVMTGGNGVGGADETSENLSFTWHGDSVATPNAAPQVVIVPNIKKLLLTEFVVTPGGAEFVEIHNPGDNTVTLTNYYLTDATFQSGNTFYWQIVNTGLLSPAGGGGSFGDWHAKFPTGATIDPGEYQTIALGGDSLFFIEYGVDPTYELYEDEVAADAIPDMLEADTGSISGQGGLTDGDEVIILYFWDGATDLVTDIDYVNYGGNNEQVDKTGVLVDGPDADTDSTLYFPDVAIADQGQAPVPAEGFSSQRVSLDEGIQVKSGSNGIGGASETSENLGVTWYALSTPTPNLAHNVEYLELTIAEMEVDANGDFQPDRLGQMVRIHGVISTPNIVGSNTSHYLDDGTAGTDFFIPESADDPDSLFFMGDSVVIEGVVGFFAGLNEILPANGAKVTVLARNAEIRVQSVSITDIQDVVGEEWEGEIVAIDEIVWLVDELEWPGGPGVSKDLFVTDGPDTMKMRLDDDMGLGGDPRPSGKFRLSGFVSQFAGNNPPDDNYSVIPRGFEDMKLLDAAVITSATQSGDNGVIVAFTASPRDTAGAPSPIAVVDYTVMAFFDDDTEQLLGTVTADNSADYILSALLTDGDEAYIVVLANNALSSLWSEGAHFQKVVGIADNDVLPKSFDISANYPNPFNPTTTINYQVPKTAHVKIVIFNLLGQKVATLVDDELVAGFHSTQFNGLTDRGRQLSSGIYFYRMTIGDFSKTQKMMFLK